MTDPTTPGPEPGAPATPPPAPAADLVSPDDAAPPAPAAAFGASPDEAGPAPADPAPADPAPADPAAHDSEASGPPPGGTRRSAVLASVAMLALGAVVGIAGFALATGAVGGAAPTPTPAPTAAPTAPATAAPVGNTFGRPDAPVTIEVWADYQCPYCRLEDLLFGGAIDREYVTPGVARVVYRDFAFLGQESTDAAVASRCAGAQEPAAQLRYHDALYTFQQGENQGRFVRENLVQVAEIAGVPSKEAFTACLDDPAMAQAVADETTAGRNVGVTSTPTIRMRGPGGERVLTGFSQTWPPLREAIEAVRVAPPPSASPAPSSSAAPSPTP